MYSPSGHPRYGWICSLIWTNLEKCTSLAHQDPLQWMGAIRMSLQTAYKNITIIHKNISYPAVFLLTNKPLHKMLTDGLELCGLLWCFYQLVELSFWWHPFTSLMRKWCNATFLQIYSDEETSSSTSWSTFSFLWITTPLRWCRLFGPVSQTGLRLSQDYSSIRTFKQLLLKCLEIKTLLVCILRQNKSTDII